MPKTVRRDYRSSKHSGKEDGVLTRGVVRVAAVIIGLSVIYTLLVGRSTVWGEKARYSMAAVARGGSVELISYNPVEKKVDVLVLPSDLKIRSRTVGSYSVGNLYQLGTYDGNVGEFARSKIQGFLRVPIPGYLLVDNTGGRAEVVRGLVIYRGGEVSNLSVVDRTILAWRSLTYSWEVIGEEELVKESVIYREEGEYVYDQRRLSEFVRARYLDWAASSENISVTVINESGEVGLGADVAEFMENIGMNLVQIKSSEVVGVESEMVIKSVEILDSYSYHVISKFLGIDQYSVGDTSEERADIVVKVRDDMKANF